VEWTAIALNFVSPKVTVNTSIQAKGSDTVVLTGEIKEAGIATGKTVFYQKPPSSNLEGL